MMCSSISSLGMTILELASDLDLPRGGEGWHILRRGQIPEEFLRSKFHIHLKDGRNVLLYFLNVT